MLRVEMELVGYSDPLSVRPGQDMSFMVSSRVDRYRASVVRVLHGDPNPSGPGVIEEHVPSTIEGDYAGRYQAINSGSYVTIDDHPSLRPPSLTLILHVFPTMPDKPLQVVMSKWSEADRTGYGLFLDEGVPRFVVNVAGSELVVSADEPLVSHRWHRLAAVYDASQGQAMLVHESLERGDGHSTAPAVFVARSGGPGAIDHSSGPLLLAAAWSGEGAGPRSAVAHYNGKIGAPRMLSIPLAPSEIGRWSSPGIDVLHPDLVASWDLGAAHDTVAVVDRSPNARHGSTVNMPTRAVTGHRWDGSQVHFALAPAGYDAIHFHDDDLEDARWDPDVEWTLPDDLHSGIYALRLSGSDGDPDGGDRVPFFVLPERGATERIAFLASTNSYYAYSNERLEDAGRTPRRAAYTGDQDRYEYIVNHRLLSLYDLHSDGTGVCHVTRLAPNTTMRPDHRLRLNDVPHVFSADLQVVEWLEHEGYGFDVLTDEALHTEGRSLLDPYDVVLTGTHPEYWSAPMLDAVDAYLRAGGRMMYLGGNGFYWVTAFHPDRPHVIEVRRPPGATRAWETLPGEAHLASTGEPGGLWRHRGRTPQRLVGVGFTAQGFDANAPYRVNPDLDPAYSFVFEGVDLDAGIVGDQPSLVFGRGAAGFELDRADHGLGTPSDTIVLASSHHADYTDSYQHVVEETLMSDSRQGATVNPLVRADLVMVPYPNGGAVFSTGSIAWSGGLGVLDHHSDVSKITRNVLEAFLRPDWRA